MIKDLKNNWIKLLFVSGLFFSAASLIFTENYRNISVIILGATIAINFFLRTKNDTSILNKTLLFNSVFFVVIALSLFFSSNLDYGLKRVIAMLGLILFPLAFYMMQSRHNVDYSKISRQIYLIFFLSCVAFFIGVAIQNYLNGYYTELIFRDYSERLNSKYGKYSMHPIYASLYISVALIFSMPIYKSIQRKLHKAALLVAVLFLTIIFLVLSRKGIIATTFIVFLIYFLKSQKRKYVYYYVIAIIVFLAIVYQIPPIKNRYLEFVNAFMNSNPEKIGSTSLRLKIYDCTFDAIFNKPIFGYGIGDMKVMLKACYLSNDEIFSGKYYNTHNQFLSAWLSAGIFGIISLISMAVYNLKNAIKNADFIHIALLSILFVTMMTENILERQNGVLLVAFIINFFAFRSIPIKETN